MYPTVGNFSQVIPNQTGPLQRDQDPDAALQVKVRREAARVRAQYGEHEEISGFRDEFKKTLDFLFLFTGGREHAVPAAREGGVRPLVHPHQASDRRADDALEAEILLGTGKCRV